MSQEQRDSYVIPPNFIEGGSFFGGLFKARNVVEAVILAAGTGLPILTLRLMTDCGCVEWRKIDVDTDRPDHSALPDLAAAGTSGAHRDRGDAALVLYHSLFSLSAQPQKSK